MIHPKTELRFISNEIGYGVVATEFIPAGTITWTLDKLDREFSPLEFQSMEPIYQEILDTYTFRNNNGNFVLCWDNGRYVNHSFNSNCLTTAYDFEIAVRDIIAGAQLTDDYGYLNLPRPFRGIDEGTKRKTVYPDDLIKYYKTWDKKLLRVFWKIPTLEQPLRTLISDKLWREIEDVSQREKGDGVDLNKLLSGASKPLKIKVMSLIFSPQSSQRYQKLNIDSILNAWKEDFSKF